MRAARLSLSSAFGAYCVCLAGAAPAAVVVGGNTWLQPADFTDLSWSDIAGVCNPDNGQCNGALSGVGVTGYEWATRDQVWALFTQFGVPLAPPYVTSEYASAWAPAFLDTFTATQVGTGLRPYEFVHGWTRTESVVSEAFSASLIDYYVEEDPDLLDTANATFTNNKLFRNDAIGAWLFRQAEVPAPSPVSLLVHALVFLFARTHRRAPAAAAPRD